MRGRGGAYTLTEQIRRLTQYWEKFAVYGQKLDEKVRHQWEGSGAGSMQASGEADGYDRKGEFKMKLYS